MQMVETPPGVGALRIGATYIFLGTKGSQTRSTLNII